MAEKTPEQQSSATNVRVDVHVETPKPRWKYEVDGVKKDSEQIKRELRATLLASGMSEEEISSRFKNSIDRPQNTDEDILRIAHNMLAERNILTQPEKEVASQPVAQEAGNVSPEHVRLEEFTKLLQDPLRRGELLSSIEAQESAINALITSLGKKKTEMGELENNKEVEGWKLYRRQLPSLKKFFREMDNGKPIPLSEQVVAARYDLWHEFFDVSGQTIQFMRRMLAEEKNVVTNDAKKEQIPVSKVDTAKPIEAEKTDGPKPEDKKEEKTPEDPYAWRKGIEKFEGDLEYRKHYEDWLDDIQETLAKRIPQGFADEKFKQIEGFSQEVKALLAEQTLGEERSGMYGQILESDYTQEQKEAVAGKIRQILTLVDEIKTDFDLSQEKEKVEVIPPEVQKVETSAAEATEVKQPSEYEKAKASWREARKASDSLEIEYQTALKDYYKSLEGQSLWTGGKWKHNLNKFFGVRPELTPELEALKEKTVEARKLYVSQGLLFAEERYKVDPNTGIHSAFGEDAEKRKGAESRALGAYGDKVMERYKQKLGQKLVVHTVAKRMELQKQAIQELHPNRTKIMKVLEIMRKYRTARMVMSIGAYALVAAASGGAGAITVAGMTGLKSLGVVLAPGTGARAGVATNENFQALFVDRKENKYQDTRKDVGSKVFTSQNIADVNIEEMEQRMEQGIRSVEKVKLAQKITSVGAAVAAGFAVGGGLTSVANALDVVDHIPSAGVAKPSMAGASTENIQKDFSTPPANTFAQEARSEIPEDSLPKPLVNMFTEGPKMPEVIDLDALSQQEVAKMYEEENASKNEVTKHSFVVENDHIVRDIPEARVKDDQVFTESRVKDDVVERTVPEIPKESMPKTFVDLLAGGPKMPEVPETPKAPSGLDSFRKMEEGFMSDDLKDLEKDLKPFEDKNPNIPEQTPAPRIDMYEVQRGDNLWNILEGDVKGRPMSEVLESIPAKDRDAVLSKLFEKVDNDPTLREAIGMKSDHADKIFVGEKLNIFALDKALGETYLEMQNGTPNSGEIRVPEPRPSIPVPESKPSLESVEPSLTEKPTVEETLPKAEPRIQEIQPNNNLDQKMEKYPDPFKQGDIPLVQQASLGSVEMPISEPLVEASQNDTALPQEVEARKQANIDKVEKPKGSIFNIFGGTNIQGTFKGMENLTFDQIAEAQQNAQIREGKFIERNITEDGWNKWVDEVNRLVEAGADIQPKDTLGSFMDRVAENQVRNGVIT